MGKRKPKSVERPKRESGKIDKALEAVLTADVERIQGVWREARTCRRKLSKLNPIEHNPVAAEIAKIEIESLRKRTKIISGGHVMGFNESGVVNVNDAALLFDHTFGDPLCSTEYFLPPYANKQVDWFGAAVQAASGVDFAATAETKTGNFEAWGEIVHDTDPLTVIAGFKINFRLRAPFNPLTVAAGVKPPTRFGRMQIVADFAPLAHSWQVYSNGLPASSSGKVVLVVWAHHDTLTNSFPVWNDSILWKNPSWPDRFWEYTSAVSRQFESPWFGADSMTEYSAYVYVRVDVLGNAYPNFRNYPLTHDDRPPEKYGYASGSIRGRLRSVKIRQCLLP